MLQNWLKGTEEFTTIGFLENQKKIMAILVKYFAFEELRYEVERLKLRRKTAFPKINIIISI